MCSTHYCDPPNKPVSTFFHSTNNNNTPSIESLYVVLSISCDPALCKQPLCSFLVGRGGGGRLVLMLAASRRASRMRSSCAWPTRRRRKAASLACVALDNFTSSPSSILLFTSLCCDISCTFLSSFSSRSLKTFKSQKQRAAARSRLFSTAVFVGPQGTAETLRRPPPVQGVSKLDKMTIESGVSLRKKDPTTKQLRSGFGSQTKSTSASEPSWGFGTSVRDASLKVSS